MYSQVTIALLQITATAMLVLISGCSSQTAYEFCSEQDVDSYSCPESCDVCYFKFTVQRLITFTRYAGGDLGLGKSYYIDDTGKLVHLPLGPDRTGCNDTNCTQANTADGVTYRTFIGINTMLPGPTLVVYQNQTMVVDVINTLVTEPVTIHWHGLEQFNTPWMDGAEIITQCPIAPGTSFRYIFKASQAGSFWYHSHSGFQRADGLAGGLIIRDRSDSPDKYPIDFVDIPESHTLTLLDWQREIGTDLFWKGLSKLRRFSPQGDPYDSVPLGVATGPDDFVNITTPTVDASGVGIIPFWSVLINGLGKYPELSFNNSRVSVFSVEPNNTYRFRLIGMMGVYALRVCIDGHKLTVIATDGNYIEPVEADYVILHSGERYDILVNATQTEQDDFWIRAQTLEVANFDKSKLPPYAAPYGHEGLAILHYNRDNTPIPYGPEYANITNITKDCTEDEKCIAVNCPFQDYHPVYNITCRNVGTLRLQFPSPLDLLPSDTPDIEQVLNFAFEFGPRLSSVNARSFLLPVISPHIFPSKIDPSSVCKSEDQCKEGCLCTHILDIPYNKTVRLIFSSAGHNGSPNRRMFTHPIHLHGHEFQVVAVGYGTYNETNGEVLSSSEDIVCADGSTMNVCINPSWSSIAPELPKVDQYTLTKDTIMVPALGYVVIEFRSTNPGWWFLHCHMWPHVAEGMAVVINEAEDRSPPPPKGICDPGNFTWTLEDFNKAIDFTYTPTPTMTLTTTSPTSSPTTSPTSMEESTTDSPATAGLSTGDENECEMLRDAFVGVAVVLIIFVVLGIALHVVVIFLLVHKKWQGFFKNGESSAKETLKETTVVNVSIP